MSGRCGAPYDCRVSATLQEFAGLPGVELVEEGLADLSHGAETPAAMAVSAAATRLRSVGVEVPPSGVEIPSHRLFELLAETDSAGAHSRYNAIVGRVASFARAAEHASPG